jgi:hypothetical protein
MVEQVVSKSNQGSVVKSLKWEKSNESEKIMYGGNDVKSVSIGVWMFGWETLETVGHGDERGSWKVKSVLENLGTSLNGVKTV